MRISHAYETAKGFKAKLEELDRIISRFETLVKLYDGAYYWSILSELRKERAELVSSIGK